MAPPRKSGRVTKPKQHFESAPYPLRKPQNAPPKPQTALQPVRAESPPMLNSDHPGDPPLPFPKFNPLVINYHTAKIQLPKSTRTPFEIFNLFFSPELLTMIIAATNSHAAAHHVNTNHP